MNFFDWNVLLLAARWVMIAVFYFVLLVLISSVYRETSTRLANRQPAGETGSFGRLRVVNPGADVRLATGTVLRLKTSTSLGTAPDNDIVVNDQYVSAHHLRLQYDGSSWWLEDLHSRNGTYLNNQPLLPGQPQTILPGAVISAGEMAMELVE